MTTTKPGITRGMLILPSTCHREQPSTTAASSISLGTSMKKPIINQIQTATLTFNTGASLNFSILSPIVFSCSSRLWSPYVNANFRRRVDIFSREKTKLRDLTKFHLIIFSTESFFVLFALLIALYECPKVAVTFTLVISCASSKFSTMTFMNITLASKLSVLLTFCPDAKGTSKAHKSSVS